MRLPDHGTLLLAAPILLLGLWCIVGWGQHSELRCDRALPASNCSLVSTSLIRREAYHFSADDMIGVRIDVRLRSDGDGGTSEEHRAILLLQGEERPLSTFGEKHSLELEAAVNEFIANPRLRTLDRRTDNRWFAWPSGVVILLVGVVLLHME